MPKKIAEIAAEEAVGVIVIGLPLDANSEVGPQARKSIRLAEAIREFTQIPIHLWDESGTTQTAIGSRVALGTSRKKRKGHLDDLAASILLQDFLIQNEDWVRGEENHHAKKQRRSLFLLIVILILLIGCVGLVTGYLVCLTTGHCLLWPVIRYVVDYATYHLPLELFSNRAKMISPTDPALPEQSFTVGQGESVAMVCIRLEDEGFIPDAELFRIYLVYSGLDRQLQSGEYILSGQMSPMDIAADMLDATPGMPL